MKEKLQIGDLVAHEHTGEVGWVISIRQYAELDANPDCAVEWDDGETSWNFYSNCLYWKKHAKTLTKKKK